MNLMELHDEIAKVLATRPGAGKALVQLEVLTDDGLAVTRDVPSVRVAVTPASTCNACGATHPESLTFILRGSQ